MSIGNRMPSVWTQRQCGISSPGPARSRLSSARPRSRGRKPVATGTTTPPTRRRRRRRKRRGSKSIVRSTPPRLPAPLAVAAGRRSPPRAGWVQACVHERLVSRGARTRRRTWATRDGEPRRPGIRDGKSNAQRQLRVGLGLRSRVRGAPLLVQRGRLLPARRAGGGQARFHRTRASQPEELHDLVELAVNGEIRESASALGEHVNANWIELVGGSQKSLVHWIRRLVFRGAWLDQRVKEGELDIVFDERTNTFGYIQPDRDHEPIELSREPSWRALAYRR